MPENDLQKYEEPLTPAEQQRLEDYEEVISAKLKAFYDVGRALAEIRDSRLYREQYSTFEEYCRDRWDMGRRTAYQLVDASSVYENVRNCAQTPANEFQVRPLTKLDSEQQAEAWQKAVETAPEGKVTAKHVKSVVNEMVEPKEKKKPSQKLVWRNIEASFANLSHYIKEYAEFPPPDDFDCEDIRIKMRKLNIYLKEVL